MDAQPNFEKRPCIECGCVTPDLVTGAVIYPHRPDLHKKPIWLCPCGAYVGCHPNTTDPLGSPAGQKTRHARQYVHRVLDPIWKNAPDFYGPDMKAGKARRIARTRTYAYLGNKMGLGKKRTHTGMFNIPQCRTAYRILKGLTYDDIRKWAKEARDS